MGFGADRDSHCVVKLEHHSMFIIPSFMTTCPPSTTENMTPDHRKDRNIMLALRILNCPSSIVYMRNGDGGDIPNTIDKTSQYQHLTLLLSQEQPSELYDKEENPSAQMGISKIRNIQTNAVHPPLTLIIPAHEASPFIESLMMTLRNQTYTNLRLIFLLEPDADVDITEAAIRRHFHEDKHRHFQSLHIHRQTERLYYQENMNFLLGRVDTDLFSYMPSDDLLSSNYYEELVQCLEMNERATNCYPETLTMVIKKKSSEVKYVRKYMSSSMGPVHERVEKVAAGKLTIDCH